MSYVLSIGTSLPDYQLSQSDAIQFAREMFKDSFQDIERLLKSFTNGDIESRQFVKPLEWYFANHSFQEKNRVYIEMALKHSIDAVQACLTNERLGQAVLPEQIDAIIFVSSTGLSTPSIEAKLMNALPFRKSTKRMPLWGLGCAGGASGLSRAHEYCQAFPEAFVLVIAVELCSLTFQQGDKSKSNLIGTSLFGDGIACALLCGDEARRNLDCNSLFPKILNTQSMLMEHSEDVMGWEFTDEGFKVIFSRDIPAIIQQWLKRNVDTFLEQNQLEINKIGPFLAHPGGKKVLDAYKKSLSMSDSQLEFSKRVLAKHGNMSSSTVFFVLEEHARRNKIGIEKYGLIGALGPGFSSELLLVSWERVEA
ncbi:3-oxoacyl-[acyl-carrier-protein] synthase III C-terminal domain-containing protein [Bacillus gobiensis]|uniref:type III polyketide synthase n=1 Tax=Bacillus gobiensis TaxID=1441095 RepID=UPI003D1B5219